MNTTPTPTPRHDVKISFDDGDYILTGLNGTEAEIRAYYRVGQAFERHDFTPHHVTKVEILN